MKHDNKQSHGFYSKNNNLHIYVSFLQIFKQTRYTFVHVVLKNMNMYLMRDLMSNDIRLLKIFFFPLQLYIRIKLFNG